MSEIAEKMKQQNITKEDNGAVLIDFTQHLPGKEGKRLGTTVLRYAAFSLDSCLIITDFIPLQKT